MKEHHYHRSWISPSPSPCVRAQPTGLSETISSMSAPSRTTPFTNCVTVPAASRRSNRSLLGPFLPRPRDPTESTSRPTGATGSCRSRTACPLVPSTSSIRLTTSGSATLRWECFRNDVHLALYRASLRSQLRSARRYEAEQHLGRRDEHDDRGRAHRRRYHAPWLPDERERQPTSTP